MGYNVSDGNFLKDLAHPKTFQTGCQRSFSKHIA